MESERDVAWAGRIGRVRRGLLNFAIGVSLLVCGATVVLSRTELDEWWGHTARGATPPGTGMRFFRTGVQVAWVGKVDPPVVDWGGAMASEWRAAWTADLDKRFGLGEWSGWGFVFGRWANIERLSKRVVGPVKVSVPVCTGVTTYGLIPCWAVVAAGLVLPGVWLVKHRTAWIPRAAGKKARGRLRVVRAVVSLVLPLVVAVVWVRSYWVWEGISWVGPQTKTEDLSIAPPEPEVAATELWLTAWPGQFRLGFERDVTTRRDSWTLAFSLSKRGLHRHTASAENTRHLRVEPWDPVPKRWMGFMYLQTDSRGTGAFDTLVVLGIPMWAVFGVAVLPGLRAVRRGWGRGTGGEGRCARCGYDLRGNTSGVCRECGTPTLLDATRPASGAARGARAVAYESEPLD